MASCLGLYVENGLIKYAKIAKDNEAIKIETCGVKSYDDFRTEISKIVEETASQKLPISINLSEEIYNDFEVFSLLNTKDRESAIRTEFETICAEKGLRENVFESRYLMAKNLSSDETLRAIYISANKAEIERKNRELDKYRLTTVTALPVAIANLFKFTTSDNVAILNIEEQTTLTVILDGQIYDVIKLKTGMKEIYQALNTKVNSFSKVYEICKNTNIYNAEGKESIEDNNEYLIDIIPTLYKLTEELTEVLKEYYAKIDKIYIGGTAAVIGNVDLYFEEYIKDYKFEILKPAFTEKINKKSQNNIKDYIEVNSAIATGLQGLDVGLQQMNFKKTSGGKLKDILTADIGKGGGPNLGDFKLDLSGKLDGTEKMLARLCITLLMALIVYGTTSNIIGSTITRRQNEVEKVISEANTEIALIDRDIEAVKSKTIEYSQLIKNLEEINNKVTDKIRTQNAIPNLLNQVMHVVPKNVQLTSITNIGENSIQIEAQAERYEELGYFKARLRADTILLNVTSDSGVKQGGIVKITIKGDMP